jgi:predicted ATP-dependent endonuclease of OLD family
MNIARGVILVEGPSDLLAVETLAERRERDLRSERITVFRSAARRP